MPDRRDAEGRLWKYNDAEGTYTYKKACIGCGNRNGSKWMDWNKPGSEEFTTLREAMESIGTQQDDEPTRRDHEIIVSTYTRANIMIGVSWYDPTCVDSAASNHPCLQAVIVRGSDSKLIKYDARQTRAIMSRAERVALQRDDTNNVRRHYAEVINDHYTK